jgi:hypothetical protein
MKRWVRPRASASVGAQGRRSRLPSSSVGRRCSMPFRPGPLGTPETDAAHLNGHRPLPAAGTTTISKTSARQFTTRLRAKQVATRTPRREGSMRVALDDKSTVEDRLFGTARAGGAGQRSTRAWRRASRLLAIAFRATESRIVWAPSCCSSVLPVPRPMPRPPAIRGGISSCDQPLGYPGT